MARRAFTSLALAALTAAGTALVASTPVAAAATNVTGTWHSVYHCQQGWCAGSDFPDDITLNQATGSSSVTGTDQGGAQFTGTASGSALSLHYTSGSYAGDYNVTISADGKSWSGTSSDNQGTSGTDTATRDNVPSSVSIAVRPQVPAGGLGVGDTIPVQVIVAAGSSDLSALSLGSGLIASGGAVSVTKRPAGTSGFALAAGTARSFVYEVTALKPGTATLSATVTGQDDSGQNVQDSNTSTFPVSSHALRITMVTTPSKVTLTADDKGKIQPKTLQVTVRLTNTTKATLTDVSLQSLRPVPADATQRLDQLAFAKGTLPIAFGSIAGGTSKVKTLPLKVTGDGDYLIKALALYADKTQSGGNGRAYAEGAPFTVAVPLLFFTAREDGGDNVTVTGGHPWFVSGYVENLSSFRTICLRPLLPGWSGNSGGLAPHRIDIAARDGSYPPLVGTLTPGKRVPWLLRIDTESDGGTRSAITLKPQATRGDDGDTCAVESTEKRPLLSGSAVKIAKGSTSFHAHVDVSHDTRSGAGVFEFFGALGTGSYTIVGQLCESTIAFAREYGGVPKLLAALRAIDAKNAVKRTARALAQTTHLTVAIAQFWLNATQQEKDQLLGEIYNDVANKADAVWAGTEAAIQSSAKSWFDTVVSAYYSGDTSRMFAALGKNASGLTGMAIDYAKWEIGFALVRRAATLTKVAARTVAESGTLTALKAVPVGRLLTADEMQRLWGLSKADVAAFKRIAEEEGVLIGVRGRAPISVKNLEEGAVWKHENIKPKNVNDIDMKYLGFSTEDNGLVAFRSYTDAQKKAILARIDAAPLSATQRKAVLERAQIRFAESGENLAKIEKFSQQGQIDVGFNYRDNGLDQESTSQVRGFHLDVQKLDGGSHYYRPIQENLAYDNASSWPQWCRQVASKVLCRITGDMDGVYLTNVGGTSLSDAQRLRVYQRLAAAGWQHPETLTWVKDDGQFFFGAKAGILSKLQIGGEAMVEFAPDGRTRATYFDLRKSYLFSKDSYYIDIVGGYLGLN